MAQTKVKLVSNGVITVDNLHVNHGITTDHIGEGSVLYYTDARVQNYLTTNNYITTSDVAANETLTSLSLAANILTYTDEAGNATNLDLSLYLDDTNLARLISGTLDGQTGIATFTRDDASTFTVDFSSLTPSETDPVFTASAASGITSTNISNWNTAYGWGNHASAGYLTSFTESDPTVPAHVKSITTTNISNWNTAYGWGNHASAGYLTTVPAPLTSFSTSAWAGGGGYPGYIFAGGNSRFGFSSTAGVVDIYADGNFYATDSSHLVWHAGNDGAGSGLDADLLDGVQGASYLRSDANDTYTGTLTVNGTVVMGREYGVTQLHNNRDHIKLGSGLVWRRTNYTYVNHATSSETLSDDLRGGTYVSQGVVASVSNFTFSADGYMVEFVGYYWASSAGTYNFSVSGDDSCDMFIDGTRVAFWYGGHGDNDAATGGSLGSGGGTVQTPGSIYLEKGFHRLYARFQEGSGGDSLSLWHKVPGGSYEKIPSSVLYHHPSDIMRSDSNGAVYFSNDVVAYASSDVRFKDNLSKIQSPIEKIYKLTGYEFDWNTNQPTHQGHDIGVVAQEVEKVLPEVVMTREDGYKAVKYEKLVPVLIEAIKEQQQQIEELKALIKK